MWWIKWSFEAKGKTGLRGLPGIKHSSLFFIIICYKFFSVNSYKFQSDVSSKIKPRKISGCWTMGNHYSQVCYLQESLYLIGLIRILRAKWSIVNTNCLKFTSEAEGRTGLRGHPGIKHSSLFFLIICYNYFYANSYKFQSDVSSKIKPRKISGCWTTGKPL